MGLVCVGIGVGMGTRANLCKWFDVGVCVDMGREYGWMWVYVGFG